MADQQISEQLQRKLDRLDGPPFITGTVTWEGAVQGAAEMVMHTDAQKANGWRWNVHEQWWCSSSMWRLNDEQALDVVNWLHSMGWMDFEVHERLEEHYLRRINDAQRGEDEELNSLLD